MAYNFTPEENAVLEEEDRRYAAMVAAIDAEAAYDALIAELSIVEDAYNLYLTDPNVDLENIDRSLARGSAEYFRNLISCASMAAGMRAEEAGFDLNAALGRSIY